MSTDLRYSDKHVWVKVEGEKIRVGITNFAQAKLGDIVFVELPEPGDEVTADEQFGEIETDKRDLKILKLIAPVGGKIADVNGDFYDHPEFVNESPYEKGWLVVIEPLDHSRIEKLLTAEQYEAIINKD
ncbi:glycine cleavage system protein GcvH [Bacillus sp. EB600]|uniref:glycine cleavage system protein GcvH n=1 Tax=Bacillus sp. EB600 TaxID=2806345 RepID=UPI00210D5324|nr:glycine cleavage system protein GcvH [Bacillus sp. EB600]MCQ6279004.1 glycine cleavage system protein GcvH [Bacillus sp. EB600]